MYAEFEYDIHIFISVSFFSRSYTSKFWLYKLGQGQSQGKNVKEKSMYAELEYDVHFDLRDLLFKVK